MKILVYEHVSGGGFAERPIPASILSEGFGMLRTLTTDFSAAGHSVTTFLDSRIAAFAPPLEAERIVSVSSSKKVNTLIKEAAHLVHAVYVIAPESNKILESTLSELESERVLSMNSLSSTIAAVSNKDSLSKQLRKVGLPTPNSLTLDVRGDIVEKAQLVDERIGFPAVFKPVSDAGMAGVSLVHNKTEVSAAVEKITMESTSQQFIAQELAKGVPASVSLISTGEESRAISLNKQKITLVQPNSTSTYDGGEAPLDSPLKLKVLTMAKGVVDSYKGLRGFVGVDFVITEKEPIVIEVNPRLTTSYIGLREVTTYNPAQAILSATIQNKLPTDKPSKGWSCFAKIKIQNVSHITLHKTFTMRGVVSPPFPVSSGSNAFALISSRGTTQKEAALQFRRMKNQLLRASELKGNYSG